MKLRLLDFLVCPLDQTPLELVEWDSSRVSLSREATGRIKRLGLDASLFSTEIATGALVNRERRIFYPIHEGVPRMLVFPTGVAQQFVATNADRVAKELKGFTLPDESPATGEETVLRTFSSDSCTRTGLMSKPNVLTPNFLAAAIGIRPSPQPRS